MDTSWAMWSFVPLGFLVGAIGTFVGAGGGFLLVPFLAFYDATLSPSEITGITLAVAFGNSFSGSVAYAKARRIDYRSGLAFALASIPGALLGATSSTLLPRRVFATAFGLFMIGVAALLWFKPAPKRPRPAPRFGKAERRFTDSAGTLHHYVFNLPLGIGLSMGVGLLSSLLGIGGGLIHVPVMTFLLNFPVHIATATSHFTMVLMTLSATVAHASMGLFDGRILVMTCALTAGVIPGAQLGAALSARAKNNTILRGLALGLFIVALRLLWVG